MCNGFEKIIAFIIGDDERRETLDFDFSHGFHSKFFKINNLYRFDVFFG